MALGFLNKMFNLVRKIQSSLRKLCVVVLLGVISGALLYIRDDFKAVDRRTVLQVCGLEVILYRS